MMKNVYFITTREGLKYKKPYKYEKQPSKFTSKQFPARGAHFAYIHNQNSQLTGNCQNESHRLKPCRNCHD